MKEKKMNLHLGQVAGALFGFAAVLLLIIVFRMIRYYFNYQALLLALAMGFFGAVLLLKRRDNLLLIAAGVATLMELLFGGLIGFVGMVLLLLMVLALASPFLPQLSELAKKAWFAPAIVVFLSNLLSVHSFAALLLALCMGAGTLLCGMWLAYPNGMPKTAVTGGTSAVSGSTTVSAPAVEGYCELFKHVLLLLLTCGVWYFIWIYRMTRYLNRVGGEKERNPVAELLLCMFVPCYSIYWMYKSGQRVDRLAGAVGVESRLATLSLLLAAFLYIIAPVVLQDKVNTIIDVERGARARDFDPAQKPAMAMRVPVETVDGFCNLFLHLLLLLLTFGIWNFIWIYRTTAYLNRVKGEEQRNPVTKLLLCMFVPFYAIYWNYKSAQRVDKLAAEVGVKSDLGVLILILSMVIGLVPQVLLQDKINEIITKENQIPAAAATEPPVALEAPADPVVENLADSLVGSLKVAPVEEPAEEPVEEPADAPAEMPAETPAEPPVAPQENWKDDGKEFLKD